MKSSEKMKEDLRKEFDSVIKMSINAELNIEDDTPVPTDEDMKERGYSLPPEDMYKRIKEACKENSSVVKKGKVKLSKKRILLIAAVIAIFTVGMLNASAVKVYILKTITKVTDNSVKIFGSNGGYVESTKESDNPYKDAEDGLGVTLRKAEYLPVGMIIEDVKIIEDVRVKITYKDGAGRCIKLNAELIKDAGEFGRVINSADADIEDKQIGDKKVTFIYYTRANSEEWIDAMWNDSEVSYNISTNIEKEEFEKFIDGMK